VFNKSTCFLWPFASLIPFHFICSHLSASTEAVITLPTELRFFAPSGDIVPGEGKFSWIKSWRDSRRTEREFHGYGHEDEDEEGAHGFNFSHYSERMPEESSGFALMALLPSWTKKSLSITSTKSPLVKIVYSELGNIEVSTLMWFP
jgi:hypothetical protein